MNEIKIYLAHRTSTRFIEQQVNLIRKYFKHNDDSILKIYGFVDCPINPDNMRHLWLKMGVEPIEIPQIIDNINRCHASVNVSFGLAFNYVYKNYILTDKHISIIMENDVFPFKEINIDNYVKDYEICGDIRFNASFLPIRITHFWLGFIIFNNKIMTDREKFSGLCTEIIPRNSNNKYWTDCGGTSYYWINAKQRNIRQMVTNGNENYDGFTSLQCTPHNITYDIQNLPVVFRENYNPYYRVLVYDNCLIHLERMGKEDQNAKFDWWVNCYNKII
jgi:hypothetical protein